MTKSLTLFALLALSTLSIAQAAEPVHCSGFIRPVYPNDGGLAAPIARVSFGSTFDIDSRVKPGVRPWERKIVLAEADGYKITVHRIATSALTLSPEMILEISPSNSNARVAYALGQNHVSLNMNVDQKNFSFRCKEAAEERKHNDLLCGDPRSANEASPYFKTCVSICELGEKMFSDMDTCAPYLKK